MSITDPLGRLDQTNHLDDEIVRAWLNDELPDEVASAVELHLEGCDACARLIDRIPLAESVDVHAMLRVPASSDSRDTAVATDIPRPVSDLVHESLVPVSKTQWTSLKRWKRLYLLAAGGIGEVWIAQDLQFHRQVALKCLRQDVAHIKSVQKRFLREARITASLNHPCVSPVFDLHENGPDSFYIMALVEGDTLRSQIQLHHQSKRDNRTDNFESLLQLLNHFVTVANTIAFAHERSIIHRDVKSDNVVIGNRGQVMVVDWGLAKHLSDPEVTPMTDASVFAKETQTHLGSRLGTPAFMAPEQVTGDIDAIDARTDVYGLAGMLYEIATGSPPFPRAGAVDVYDAVLTQVPPAFSSFDVHSLSGIESICKKGLSKDPQDRFSCASDIAAAVQHWIAEEVSALQKTSEREYFFSFTEDMMAILDDERGIRWANPAWYKSLGWHPDALIGKTRFELIHPDDYRIVETSLRSLREGNQTAIVEVRNYCCDGTYRWCHWTATRVPNERSTHILGHDITRTRRREACLSQMLSSTNVPIMVVDQSLQVVEFNEPVAQTLSLGRFNGQPFSLVDLCDEGSEDYIKQEFNAALQSESSNHTTIACKRFIRDVKGIIERIECTIRLSPFEFEGERLFTVLLQLSTE
jgi:eukaryotic-like serine/threonine-protein kinase